MKDKEKDFLDYEEDDFMLNKSSKKEEDFVETLDLEEYIPFSKQVNEEMENKPKLEKEKIEEKKESVKEDKQESPKHKEKTKKEKKRKMKKKKSGGFKIPKTKGGKIKYFISLTFVLLSVAFIIGCCIHYGSRMLKYYKIYNPKGENGEVVTLIAASITNGIPYETEGEGAYRIAGSTIYKGTNVNNYFKYSGLNWRILSVNGDGSVDLVLDSYINNMYYNDNATTFNESSINKYLNTTFLNNINKDYLVETSYCVDTFEDIVSSCKNYVSTDYVRVPSIADFLGTIVDEKTYMNESDIFWLLEANDKEVWHTNGLNISNSKANASYYVKPVIRIKNSAVLKGGDGTKEKPYYVEENNNLGIGNYVKLDNDIWSIYNVDGDNLYLSLASTLDKMNRFSTKSNSYDTTDTTSIAYYLNNTYLNSLSYKDKLLDNDWYIGEYTGTIDSIKSKTVTAKVGMYSALDLKINDVLDNYYLLTPSQKGYVYFYNDGLTSSKINLTRNIKPTIKISKDKIATGTGTLEDPYVLGGNE